MGEDEGAKNVKKQQRPAGPIPASAYAHSPAHCAVATNDVARLTALLSTLPSLSHPSKIFTSADAARELRHAATISSLLDRRDVPCRDTPLHLAVRLNLPHLVSLLASAGADVTLQNSSGWTPLQEALCLGRKEIAALLLRRHRLAAWSKLRRRAPQLSAALHRVQDFYLEVEFHFESSLVPLLSKAAPSDTYRIWKRGADVRADTSLAGFDGLRLRRADHSFLFFGDGADDHGLPPGSLLVLHRGKREVHDAFAAAAAAGDDVDVGSSDAAAYRPGLNITQAKLVPRTTWLRKERVENVGEWKAKVFDVHNVVFSFKTLRAAGGHGDASAKDDVFGIGLDEGDEFVPLELRDDDDEDGFLVADIPPMPVKPRHSCYVPGRSSSSHSDLGHGSLSARRRNSVDVLRRLSSVREQVREGAWDRHASAAAAVNAAAVKWKEEETVKSLRPSVWLTQDFPLAVEEFLPLLDILASRVRAVRRLRELLTTKFPPGTFPVKV